MDALALDLNKAVAAALEHHVAQSPGFLFLYLSILVSVKLVEHIAGVAQGCNHLKGQATLLVLLWSHEHKQNVVAPLNILSRGTFRNFALGRLRNPVEHFFERGGQYVSGAVCDFVPDIAVHRGPPHVDLLGAQDKIHVLVSRRHDKKSCRVSVEEPGFCSATPGAHIAQHKLHESVLVLTDATRSEGKGELFDVLDCASIECGNLGEIHVVLAAKGIVDESLASNLRVRRRALVGGVSTSLVEACEAAGRS